MVHFSLRLLKQQMQLPAENRISLKIYDILDVEEVINYFVVSLSFMKKVLSLCQYYICEQPTQAFFYKFIKFREFTLKLMLSVSF